ncbi:hypothetical protein L195_g061617, partial [Trifolium pratense]
PINGNRIFIEDSPSYDSSNHGVADFDRAVGGNSNVEHKFVIPHYFRPHCGLRMPNFGIVAEEGGGEIATYHVALPDKVFVCHRKRFVSGAGGIGKCSIVRYKQSNRTVSVNLCINTQRMTF